MKSPRTIMQFALVAVALAITAAPASASQSTTTCGSGEYDMLSLMFMQQTYLSDNYYLYGNSYSWSGSGWQLNSSPYVVHNDVPQVSTKTGNAWDTGKINIVKDYQYEPGTSAPPYWGFPWDINLFDTSYVYLWITEYSGAAKWWSDPYAYKAFNNGSSNNTMRFTRRCVVPGDNGTTSQLVNGTSGTYTTDFLFVPSAGSNPTYTSSDCNTSSPGPNLGFAIMTVEAEQPSSYTLTDTVTNQNISLNIVPVSYQYNCSSDSGGCTSQEVYEYGFDSSNNNYGLVQWTLYTSPEGNGSWTPVSESVFNSLGQWTQTDLNDGKGGTTVSFPCNPL